MIETRVEGGINRFKPVCQNILEALKNLLTVLIYTVDYIQKPIMDQRCSHILPYIPPVISSKPEVRYFLDDFWMVFVWFERFFWEFFQRFFEYFGYFGLGHTGNFCTSFNSVLTQKARGSSRFNLVFHTFLPSIWCKFRSLKLAM